MKYPAILACLLLTLPLAARADPVPAQAGNPNIVLPGPDPHSPNKPGDYPLTPDSLAQPNVAHGQLLGPFEFHSHIIAGTVRQYWVYVPVGYDAAQPPNLLVFQDGQRATNPDGQIRVQNVLDNLIARGDIPPTLGVFVTPGNRSDHYPQSRHEQSRQPRQRVRRPDGCLYPDADRRTAA